MTVLLGKLTHVWNRFLSGQWLGTQGTWDEWSAVCEFLWTINWSFWLKSWCRSEVVLRSFGSRKNWLNNDPWIHSNYTIWKSDPCLNSPERVGSSVILVDMHFWFLIEWPCLQNIFCARALVAQHGEESWARKDMVWHGSRGKPRKDMVLEGNRSG